MVRLVREKDAYRVLGESLARMLINECDDEYVARHGTPLSWEQKLVLFVETMYAYHCGAAELDRSEKLSIPTPRRAIPDAVRRHVFERDHHQCLACGSAENLAIDHIVPLELGGLHCVSNFQTLCGSCNSAKGTQAIDYRLDADPSER